ncbi:O-antigen ligase family protein [Pseudomonas sp.]|uniref:O-antigen ligase family protein n=1 Tax=Pseudomonas sp. TaxID=306 RepID=UPI003CC53F95
MISSSNAYQNNTQGDTSTSTSIPKISILLFIFGALCLDINFPRYAGIKTGNILMLLSLAGSMFLILYKRSWRVPSPVLSSANRLLVLYIALAISSAMWAPSAIEVLFQATLITTTLICAATICRADYLIFIRYIYFISAAVAALSILTIFISTDLAFQPFSSDDRPELRGVFEHQLRLGLFTGLSLALVALTLLNGDFKKAFPNRILVIASAPIVLITFYMAYARLYSLFIILSFIIAICFSRSTFTKWLTTAAVVSAVVLAIIYQPYLESLLGGAGVDTSLTGRTTIWLKSIEEASNQPLIGHGFAAFDSPEYDWMWGGFYRPPHPHNSFIQAYFENGLIGLILIITLACSHLALSAKKLRSEGRYSYTLFMTTILVLGSLTGANYASKPATLFCIAILFISAKIYRLEK